MSRCFGYPPPGYEPLIDSIEKEKELPKEQRKNENSRRHHKEKKSKSTKEGGKVEDEKKYSHKKRQHDEWNQLNRTGGNNLKKRVDETKQFENSDLTVEHGVAALQYRSYCSDSSQDSKKRKKLDPTDDSNNIHGVSFVNRLPSLKLEEPKPAAPTEHPCFPGRTASTLAQRETESAPGDLSLSKSYHGTCSPRRKEVESRDLKLDWDSLSLLMEIPKVDHDDQEWLFGASRMCGDGRLYQAGDISPNLCSFPPRACYLPEAKIYALPFVVPF